MAWVLIVMFGFAQTQSSFAVSGIASQAECERLKAEIARDVSFSSMKCHAYRKAP